jgi:hypothetical protein
MKMTEDKIIELEDRFKKEVYDMIGDYVELGATSSCLDGYFCAGELRIIADRMDQLKEAYGNRI